MPFSSLQHCAVFPFYSLGVVGKKLASLSVELTQVIRETGKKEK